MSFVDGGIGALGAAGEGFRNLIGLIPVNADIVLALISLLVAWLIIRNTRITDLMLTGIIVFLFLRLGTR